MCEMLKIVTKCRNCGTTEEKLSDLERFAIDEPLIDELIPPPLIEKSLPFMALTVATLGFFALIIREPTAYYVMLLSPIFYGLYQHMKTERRQKANRRNYSEVRLESIDYRAMQQSLEKQGQIVNW